MFYYNNLEKINYKQNDKKFSDDTNILNRFDKQICSIFFFFLATHFIIILYNVSTGIQSILL